MQAQKNGIVVLAPIVERIFSIGTLELATVDGVLDESYRVQDFLTSSIMSDHVVQQWAINGAPNQWGKWMSKSSDPNLSLFSCQVLYGRPFRRRCGLIDGYDIGHLF